MAYRQLPDGRWIVYYIKGTIPEDPDRTKEYFGKGPAGEAAARRRNAQLGFRPKPSKNANEPTFSACAKIYVQNKTFNDYSRKHLKIRLEANILPFFGDMIATGITDEDMDNYIRKRQHEPVFVNTRKGRKKIKDGVKYSTIGRELTDIKAILNYCADRKPPVIPFNPVRDYKKPQPDDAIIIPPTETETRGIIKNAPAHLIRAIKISYYLGLRPGAVELLSLTWENSVDIDKGTIRIVSAKKGGPVSRLVSLHPSLLELMRDWKKEDEGRGPIIHYRRKPIRSIKKAWKATLQRAGIERRIRPYDLRHDFVTSAIERGDDIKTISEIVGSRPETLMRHYQHVTTKMHRRAIYGRVSLEDDQPGE